MHMEIAPGMRDVASTAQSGQVQHVNTRGRRRARDLWAQTNVCVCDGQTEQVADRHDMAVLRLMPATGPDHP